MQIIRFLWYFYFWLYVKIGLHYYFKRVKVTGLENIPKGVPVIFGANHENALIDPLLMTTHVARMNHYLVRADIFKNPFVKKLLGTWNLKPVYRIRDGVNSVKANQAIFQSCFDAFKEGESLMLFPEASHDHRRIVKEAKKGIARIAIGGINQENAPKELYIIPVGLTYSRHMSFRSSVTIHYGKSIKVSNIQESQGNIDALKDQFDSVLWENHAAMPRDSFPYMNSLLYHNQSPKRNINYEKMNEMARSLDNKLSKEDKNEIIKTIKELEVEGLKFPFEYRENHTLNAVATFILAPFGLLGFVLNLAAILLPKKIMKGIKDKVFYDTMHFGVGLVAMPVFTLLYAGIVYAVTNTLYLSLGALIINPVLIIIYARMVREWRLFTTNRQLNNNKKLKDKYLSFVSKVNDFRNMA